MGFVLKQVDQSPKDVVEGFRLIGKMVMEYEIRNMDDMLVWRGPSETLAYHLALWCERFPDEYFRVKVCMFD